MFYSEYATIGGRFTPQTSVLDPRNSFAVTNGTRRVRNVHRIPRDMILADLTLDQVRDRMPGGVPELVEAWADDVAAANSGKVVQS